MQISIKNWIIIAVVIVIIIIGGFLWWQQSSKPGKLDDFAKCLKDKGAVFYGAFWCPHCQDQKELFKNSEKYIPYVECSTPDSNSQLKVCSDQKIQVYPTWKFSDGTTKEGELTLQELSDKTGCQLPE